LASYYPEERATAATITRPAHQSYPKLVVGTQDSGATAEVVSLTTTLGQVQTGPAIPAQPEIARPEIEMNIGDTTSRAWVIAKLADVVAGFISSRKPPMWGQITRRADAIGGEEGSDHELLRS